MNREHNMIKEAERILSDYPGCNVVVTKMEITGSIGFHFDYKKTEKVGDIEDLGMDGKRKVIHVVEMIKKGRK